MSIKHLFLLSVFHLLLGHLSANAQKPVFSCPVTDGEMIDIDKAHFDTRTPAKAILLQSKDGSVYSCSKGTLAYISNKDSLLSVFIDFGKYSFVYHNLTTCTFKVGALIKEGAYIGSLASDKSLLLRLSINDNPVMPHKFLKCKIIE